MQNKRMFGLYVGVFLIALVTLMLELVLTRVLDVVIYANLAYMIITCAMFAFAMAGVYSALRPFPPLSSVRRRLMWLSLIYAAAVLCIVPAMNLNPFDFGSLWRAPMLRLWLFYSSVLITLAGPFFFAGLIFTTLFSAYAAQIQRLYFWDLCGAAVGCVVLIPFIPFIGPGGLVIFAAALAMIAAAFFSESRRATAGLIALSAVLVLVPVLRYPEYIDFREHINKRDVKRAKERGKDEYVRWDPISKIDIVDQTRTDSTGAVVPGTKYKHVAYDGGTQSSYMYPFNGNFEAIRAALDDSLHAHFAGRAIVASHYLKRDTDQEVLVIGSAAGQELKAAVMFGAKRVEGIELVKAVVEAGSERYADYTAGLFNHPRVHNQVGEGRSYLRGTPSKYDIIQIFSNHTSSSIAAGTGAMAAIYLQTVDAYREYFEHLKPDGVLQINHHIYPRMVTTAARAWKEMGRADFQAHVVVFEQPGIDDNLPTLLVKMSPWTAEEVAELEEYFTRPLAHMSRTYALVEDPLSSESSFLSADFYSGEIPEKLARRVPYRIEPATDDRPFFTYILTRLGRVEPDPAKFVNLSVAGRLNSWMPFVHLLVPSLVALCLAVGLVLIPLRFSVVGRERWPGRNVTSAYFACLGAGFIAIELLFIQVFMKLIGYPLYTYSTVLFTMLAAAGLGSLASHRLGVSPLRRWQWPFVGVLGAGVLMWLSYTAVFGFFLAWPLAGRILVAALLIFPLAFFLGMPFPLGILTIESNGRPAVAWAWGMNGFFTVVGGLLSVMLAIVIGFKLTLLLAVSLYAIAFLVFARLRRGSTEPAAAD